MPRNAGGGPPKRERPALAGTGTLENNNQKRKSYNKGSRREQGGRPSPAKVQTALHLFSPRRWGR
jgi:hypothetical protein